MKKVLSRVLIWGSILLALGSIVYFLENEPSAAFIEAKLSFLKVRGIALILALFLGLMTYTGGKLARGLKEIKLENDYLKDKDNSDLEADGYSPFEIWMIEAPLIGWLIWWTFCFQVMASFYVNDWLKYGF